MQYWIYHKISYITKKRAADCYKLSATQCYLSNAKHKPNQVLSLNSAVWKVHIETSNKFCLEIPS